MIILPPHRRYLVPSACMLVTLTTHPVLQLSTGAVHETRPDRICACAMHADMGYASIGLSRDQAQSRAIFIQYSIQSELASYILTKDYRNHKSW